MRGFGYILLALIIYGSLYPFHFGGGGLARLAQFFDIWHQIPSDVVENILAFVPMGVAFRLTEARALRRRDFAIAAGAALLLQIVQLWLPNRQPALTDAIWNVSGLGLGAWATTVLRWVGDRPAALSPVGLALLGLFLVHLFLVAFIGFGHAGSWEQHRLLAGWRESGWVLPTLPWFAALMAVGPLLRPRLKVLARLGMSTLIIALLWQGLTPVTWMPAPFQWVPLKSLILGFSWGVAATLAFKLFAFATLTRLMMLSGIKAHVAVLFVVTLVCGVEAAQTRLGSGNPDITDPVLALLCAWGVVQEARVHAQRLGGGLKDGLRKYR